MRSFTIEATDQVSLKSKEMKNNNFLITFSCMAIMLTASCDQTDLKKSDDVLVQVVETRSIEDCEECPVEDCCCTIEVLSAGNFLPISLQFCGTTSPVTVSPCSVSGLGICDDIMGNSEAILLNVDTRRAQFCAALNQTFGITNTLPFMPGVILAITCQDGVFPPQTVYIDLGTTGNKPYWQLGGECVLEPCF